jgi:hypothetical protein
VSDTENKAVAALPPGEKFFERLAEGSKQKDKVDLVRTLTYDVLMIEANQGRMILDIGRKLKTIRETLEASGTPSAWKSWCDAFVFSKDYANRMIQVAAVFNEDMPGMMSLSLRHLREIARLSFHDPKPENIKLLTALADQHQLSVHETRFLVTEVNKGTVSLDEVVARSPDLKQEIDRMMQQAKEQGVQESQGKINQLLNKVQELKGTSTELEGRLKDTNKEISGLKKEVKTQTAIEKLGGGDPQVGKLKMKLEQAEQERETTKVALDQSQKDIRKLQHELDRYVNSPTGQAKGDLRKAFTDVEKFFKDHMTPAYLALRVGGVASDEAIAQGLRLADAIEVWSDDLRVALEKLQKAPATPAP